MSRECSYIFGVYLFVVFVVTFSSHYITLERSNVSQFLILNTLIVLLLLN